MSLVISIWFIIYFSIALVMVLFGYEFSTMAIGVMLLTSVVVSIFNLIHERLVRSYQKLMDRSNKLLQKRIDFERDIAKIAEIEQRRSTMH